MSFLLTIENPNDAILPGQAVFGKVYCTLATPEVIEVKSRLLGVEHICNTKSTNKVGSGTQNIFLQTGWICVHSGRANRGENKFSFKIILPRDIPSSYQGKYGNVKYFVKACLTTDSEEKNDKMEFKVFSPVDLRELPNSSLVPSVHSGGLLTQKWFCFPETVNMDVKLEKIAFVVGEVVNIEVTLKNYSNLRVAAVTIELYLRVAAKVSTPTNPYLIVCQLLSAVEKPGVSPYKMKTFTSQLKIPANTEIPNFQKCKLFTKKTTLEVTAIFSNYQRNIKEEIELVLGHYSNDDKRGSLERLGGSTAVRPPPYGILSDGSADISRSSSSSLPTVIPTATPASQNSSSERVYPGSNLAPPYPVDVPLLSNEEANIPFAYPPKQSYPPRPVNGVPYPKEAPYPTELTCPYPTENSMKSPTCPYPTENSMKSPTCPYPTENSMKSRPYSITSNPLYTQEETTLFHPPYPNTNSNPYSSVSTTNPPYPREEVSNRTNATSSSFTPHRMETELDDSPKSRNMPPLPSKIDLPYPTTTSMPLAPPKYSTTAPYPIEGPPPHSTVGFAEFTPMPMPSDRSFISCGTIGFAVPTPALVGASHSSEDRPSAPLLSEEKTPPIATIEELQYIDDDDVEWEYPQVPAQPPSYEAVCRPPRGKRGGNKREIALESVPT